MKNFFRLVLLSAVALTAGFAVSCTDPDPQGGHYEGTPTISVTPASVTVPLAGGTTEAITVTTPAEWVLTIDTEGVEASATSGNGDATVTFDVPAADAMRTIKVTFTATGYVSGFPITKKTSISISQTDIKVPSIGGPFVYYDNCGDTIGNKDSFGGSWPLVSAYTGWAPTGGEGFDQSGVTYTGKNASVRNSGKTWAPVGATYATDAPYAYLQAKSDSEFVINNINIKNGVKNYTFSFTAFNQYASLIASPYTPVVTPLESGKNLTISVSVDGQNWGNVAFTTMADGNWTYAIAPFTLPADATKLYVKFSGYTADTTTALPSADYQYQAALRFDDFRLVEGGEGPVVDLTIQGGGSDNPGSGTMPENISTIAEILALGDGATIPATAIEATVISSMELNNLTSKKGMYVQDATGGLQFYLAANHEFAFGTKVKIDLTGAKLGSYNGAVQISGLALDKVVAVSTGNTVEAKTVTMEDFLANKYEGQYIALENVQVMDADLSKTWVVGGAHTSINLEDATGNTFVVFSSKYSTYGAETVAQGAGTIKGISSINNGVMQILFTQKSDYAGLSGTRFDGTAPAPTPDPEPTPTPAEGEYASDAPFVQASDNSTNAVYSLGTTTIANQTATGFKLGKSKQEGKFTSAAVGVTGDKTLNFYAVAWNGTTATLYYRVDGGAVQSVALASNSGATGNPPYNALSFSASDYHSVQLTGLTETSIIEFSTNADFALTTHSGTAPDIAPRVIVCGMKFADASTGGDQPGGETPTPDPTPDPEPTPDPTPDPTPGGVKTIAEILAAGQGASLSGTIEGVVVSNMALNNLTSKKGLYVQDETGALQFYLAANHELAFGTKVQIDLTGSTLGQYNGAVQVSGLALEKITTVSTGNTVEPKVVTMADFLANKYEGQYIALEGVQVASSDLTKTWVTGGAHTSINMEDATGNKFVVFSSKYASYGAETVAQGSGTIKGIASINNGAMQIIFAQASDYASLTGERFGTSTTPDPEPEPTPDPTPGEGTTVTATFNQMGFTNAQVVDGVDIKVDDNAIVKFSKASSSTAPAYYDASNGIRMYQNGATLDVTANGKTITNIEFVFDYSQWYLGADSGTLSAEGDTRTWTGSATAVKFTSTGTDKNHRAYIKAMTITYK